MDTAARAEQSHLMRMNFRPLVYSCSGCSSAAQMANQMAVQLDRERLAEMSCIAGVGGSIMGLVDTARSGRPILVLDGCVLACAKACLNREGVEPTTHVLLNELGVKKRMHAAFDADQARKIFAERIVPAARRLGEQMGTAGSRRELAQPARCAD